MNAYPAKSPQEPPMAGRLKVGLDSASMFFQAHAIFEIRDSALALVGRVRAGEVRWVPAGLYQVSTALDDGLEHRRLVRVVSGEDHEVTFTRPDSDSDRAVPATPYKMARWTGPFRPISDTAFVDGSGEMDAPTITEGTLIAIGRHRWRFEPARAQRRVPVFRAKFDEVQWQLSLPASAGADAGAAGSCEIALVRDGSNVRFEAWIGAERTVARSLQNMLASGEFGWAVSLADDASEVLQHKYFDPTGAALGALVLNKAGRLVERLPWLENLARDFPWLPDGRVLLALALVQARSHMDRALHMVLEASAQTLLYTETFSLLLDILRRWPTDALPEARKAAIASLGKDAPHVAWNSTCLCLKVSR